MISEIIDKKNSILIYVYIYIYIYFFFIGDQSLYIDLKKFIPKVGKYMFQGQKNREKYRKRESATRKGMLGLKGWKFGHAYGILRNQAKRRYNFS